MMEGYNWSEEREWQRMAQLAAWVISPHTRRRVTADQLLGKQQKGSGKKIPVAEQRLTLAELEKELGI